jgi:hypothetical protein
MLRRLGHHGVEDNFLKSRRSERQKEKDRQNACGD